MDELLAAVMPKLIEVGAPLLVAILTTALTLAANALRRYADSAVSDRLLDRLQAAADIAVHDLEQTVVPQLRAAAADGKIDKAELEGIRLEAGVRIRKLMGSKRMNELALELRGDVDDVVTHVIESAVRRMRGTIGERSIDIIVPGD